MSKSSKLGIIILVVLSMAFSSALTLYLQFTFGADQVNPVLQAEIDRLKAVEEKYATYQKLEELKGFIQDNYYLPTDDVPFEEGMIDGLFGALNDPYSVYMNPDEYKSFNETSAGSFGGIGIVISAGEDNLITVVAPIEDTPAERLGVKTGDKIIKVDGKEVFGNKQDEAVKMIKGEPGTEVTLTLVRGEEKPFDLKITRAIIVIKSVKSRMLPGADKLGYLRITSFDDKVTEEFISHLKALQQQGAKGLVLDLRGNPGGSLQHVVEIADYILGKQLIVYTKDNQGREERFESDAKKIDLPIVVLVDGGSASASEILTGAIKDGKAGVVIGTTTFGKGLVQTVRDLPGGDGIKLTIAQYFTPSGAYIHGKGIAPDIEVKPASDKEPANDAEDNQLQEAIKQLKLKLGQ